jgi:two-component system, cell cycle response regulator DivK
MDMTSINNNQTGKFTIFGEELKKKSGMKEYNILVVDDSTTNIVLLEAIFEGTGYRLFTALGVNEAVHSMSKILPDLILLDLKMPKISGFEFLEQLGKDDKLKNIPVIVISALTDNENITKIRNLGAVEYVSKPVDIPFLMALVEKTLHKE